MNYSWLFTKHSISSFANYQVCLYSVFRRGWCWLIWWVKESIPMALLLLGKYRRDSSVGRASDWRSEGPWFNPGSRQFFSIAHYEFTYIVHSVAIASYDRNIVIVKRLKVKTRPRWDSNPQSSDSKSDALSIRPRGHTDYSKYPQLRLVIFTFQFENPYLRAPVHRVLIQHRNTLMAHRRWHSYIFITQKGIAHISALLYDDMICSYY